MKNKCTKEINEVLEATLNQGEYYEWFDEDIKDEFEMHYDIELTTKQADAIATMINEMNKKARGIK